MKRRRPGEKDPVEFAIEALRAFADMYEGDLSCVGGGTLVTMEMNVQKFKDAKESIEKLKRLQGRR